MTAAAAKLQVATVVDSDHQNEWFQRHSTPASSLYTIPKDLVRFGCVLVSHQTSILKRDNGVSGQARRFPATEVVSWWSKVALLVLLYWFGKLGTAGGSPVVMVWRHKPREAKMRER